MTYPKELSELSFAKAAMPCARLGITDTHIYGHTDEILMRVRREVCPRDVKSSEWRDYRSTYRGKQDAPDIREETTYRDCVSWSFRPGKFLLEICMFDGDMMYGQPEGGGGERCRWGITVSERMPETCKYLMDHMIYRIRWKAEKDYEEQLTRQRNEAVNNIINRYLK